MSARKLFSNRPGTLHQLQSDCPCLALSIQTSVARSLTVSATTRNSVYTISTASRSPNRTTTTPQVWRGRPRPRLLLSGRSKICPLPRLHKQGRKQIVFGVGNPNADLMFIGEAPGADEDEQGEPFVGRAGQLLNNMIKAMGIRRQDVYIANIIKCRPPGNRTPERDECETCSPFLMRQIEAIRPRAIVALGAVAAKTLLAINAPMSELRGRWYDFRGTKLAVTYHPAFLLRDPRQKKEAWKDLQMVMKELGLQAAAKSPE